MLSSDVFPFFSQEDAPITKPTGRTIEPLLSEEVSVKSLWVPTMCTVSNCILNHLALMKVISYVACRCSSLEEDRGTT